MPGKHIPLGNDGLRLLYLLRNSPGLVRGLWARVLREVYRLLLWNDGERWF